jgi:hypothetical protein
MTSLKLNPYIAQGHGQYKKKIKSKYDTFNENFKILEAYSALTEVRNVKISYEPVGTSHSAKQTTSTVSESESESHCD